MVDCPICGKAVKTRDINAHIDSSCSKFLDSDSPPLSQVNGNSSQKPTTAQKTLTPVASFFGTPAPKRTISVITPRLDEKSDNQKTLSSISNSSASKPPVTRKRSFDDIQDTNAEGKTTDVQNETEDAVGAQHHAVTNGVPEEPLTKKTKVNIFQKVAPLAERMRPRSLDDVYGQELVGPQGVLRNLIDQDRVPSMILWGGSGTGKTTIARVISQMVGSRFVEINSTSSGVAECKKIFAEARGELSLSGRKTIIFCDEIHRFSKSQQDVFLGPVESGQITLIGATTENPSFKVQNALLSRCRTFTLQKLSDEAMNLILQRALEAEGISIPTPETKTETDADTATVSPLDAELITYLATFSDGDARTALNLLELAISLVHPPPPTSPDSRPPVPLITKSALKSALTHTLVYDRSSDQHYNTISALHKSIRGSDPDASLYYLARMLSAGEDPLYIARRLVVIASEDVGLADNSLLTLATSAYTACEKIGMPECRIALAHATVALALAKKSVRVYRGLNKALEVLREPGVGGLQVPVHLRNATSRLMREMGVGVGYKYNPNYREGRVVQAYLPGELEGRRFLEERDLGTEVDPGAWPEGDGDGEVDVDDG